MLNGKVLVSADPLARVMAVAEAWIARLRQSAADGGPEWDAEAVVALDKAEASLAMLKRETMGP